MDDIVVIALFRHGLTEENKRKAYLGWNDSPLCTESKTIATARRYDCYFSSDLKRCLNTAKLLFPNEKCSILPDLREMDFGTWQGKTYEDLQDETHYREWIADPVNVIPPNGESFQQFGARIQKGWTRITEEIIAKNIQSCAVITHGGVIKYLLSEFSPEQKGFSEWIVPHESSIELVFDRESLRRGERCTLLQAVPITAKEHG